MQLGTILGLYATRDLAGLVSLQNYAAANNGVVGTPQDTAASYALVLMKPTTRALLADCIAWLGGTPSGEWQLTPIPHLPGLTDYQLHLDLLTLLLQNQTGHYSSEAVAAADADGTANPQDPLAQAMAGNLAGAAVLLVSQAALPSYVRGSPNYNLAYQLLVARLVLQQPITQ